MTDVLDRLAQVIAERSSADPALSYVASLNEKGIDTVLKKLGEEATETILAAKGGDPDEIVRETADLWFHCLVMLVQQGVQPAQVLAELERRFGTSGITEKAARSAKAT